MSEPSLGELERRLIDLTAAVQRLADTMSTTYATKESVSSLEKLHDAEIRELKKDNDARAGQVRQITAGLIVAGLMLLLSLVGQVQSLLGSGVVK